MYNLFSQRKQYQRRRTEEKEDLTEFRSGAYS